jgi:tRNA(Leu) C34 or U34 (ribose-2'-O)-methylase TrmL
LLAAWPERTVSIPMLPGKRSLNLAVSVGVGVYGALRSLSG